MRRMWLVVVALAGCGAGVAVVPQGGLDRAVASSGPVTMTVFASEWNGSPDDLTDYLTPVAVELYNAGPSEVRVSYADFSLRDERGFRYGAINPFVPAQLGKLESDGAVLLASRGGGGFGGGRGGGGFAHSGGRSAGGGGRVIVGPPGGMRHGGGYVGGGGYLGGRGGWHGYSIYGGARGWYPGWSYWRDPFFYPPSRWVYYWGPGYYPSERPSRDVIEAALPEGVLSPGGRVNGFLYFQKATDRGRTLGLSWEAHEPRANTFVGMANVTLEVMER